MRMLDLFAGRLGWSKAFLAHGWDVVAYDLVMPSMEIPEGVDYRLADILTLSTADVQGFDFACSSSPCTEFSLFGLKCFHPNPPHPTMGIKLFNHAREILSESGIHHCLENVRSAQKFLGNAVNHCGPFYLWGDSVPPLMPQGITKGTKFGLDKDGTRTTRKTQDMYYRSGSKSKSRRDHIANVATIPPELATCVVDYAERICQ